MAFTALPLATLSCTVDATGISTPPLSLILASMQASIQAIYGSDIYIDPDSQDGQLLAVLAQAQYDSNMATIATFNAYNPQTAQGAALDSAIKINSITRQTSSPSTAQLLIGGQVGTNISAGIVRDANGYLWNLPLNTLIPPAGQVMVTATCQTQGAIIAQAGTISTPQTVISGWQTVTNTLDAVPGSPVEVDGALRERQAISTSINAETTLDAIISAVAGVPGVTRYAVYQNDGSGPNGNAPDSNGIPVHYISPVVFGGDAMAVAAAIQSKKDVGAGTYGSISEIVIDPSGVPSQINFYPLTQIPVYSAITVHPLPGYTAATGQAVVAALCSFVSGLSIGEEVYSSWCQSVAGLPNTLVQQTFVITSFTLGLTAGTLGGGNIPINFNQAAVMTPANVSLTVA